MRFRVRMQSGLSLAAGLAASVGMAAPAQAAGGFLELLFGRPAARPPVYYTPEPFDMTVRGNKRKAPHAAVHREAKESEAKSQAHLQQPLDPATDHEWFLKDPTLRKGDIIVLSDRVVVFTGARGQARMADFSDLYATSLVSRKDQEKVRGITQAPREALVRYQATPVTQAAVTAAAETFGPPKPIASTETLRP